MLIPTYHYVFNKSKIGDLGGIKPVWQDQFKIQLKWIIRHYEVLEPNEFLININNKNFIENNSNKCLITFDDGTIDQFQIAAKILEDLNLKAIFFVLSDVLKNKKVPLTHLLHIAMCNYESNYLIELILANITPDYDYNESEIYYKSGIYAYEKDISRRLLKYLINYELVNYYDQLTSILLDSLKMNEKSLCEKWFGNEENIIKARDNGHIIGNHGKSHKSYETLTNIEIKNEIIDSNKYLEDLLNEKISAFSHPQGGDNGDKNQFVREILADLNYKACFNINSTDNSSIIKPLDIPRYDAMLLSEKKV